jgi:hypothetical protein
MPTRNAVPVNRWQSVQWHTLTEFGSTSASYAIAPQWQLPVTFIVFFLALLIVILR